MVFGYFQQLVESEMDRARKEGRFDEGILEIKGSRVFTISKPIVCYTDPQSGSSTLLHKVCVDRGVPWDKALELR